MSRGDKETIKTLRLEKHWGARKICSEFPNKNWPYSSVLRLLRKIDATGSIERKRGSGRPRSGRTEVNIAQVESLALSQEDNPGSHLSCREIVFRTGIKRSTVQRIIRNDLLLKCYRRVCVQKLTEDNKRKRLERCRALLERIPRRDLSKVWFSDEKTFSLRPPKNQQNNRLYATGQRKRDVRADRLISERQHFAKNVMVAGCVSRTGKTEIVFVGENAKVNAEYYRNNILTRFFTDINRQAGNNWIFQQDGARSHTAHDTVAFLDVQAPDFIKPDCWPPNSPDLNPLDYYVWGVLQQRVYKNRTFNTIDELKTAIRIEWNNLSQRGISRAIARFIPRLLACVAARGGHIEHQFY